MKLWVPRESKYQQLGDYHWQEYSQDTIYRQHVDYVTQWVHERPVLDVGCGDGLITARFGAASGIDSDELAIHYARQHHVLAWRASVYWWDHPLWKSKAIYCGDVLEHLRFPGWALRRMRRWASVLYVVTPSKGEYPSDPYHFREWTRSELRVFLGRYGWNPGIITHNNARLYVRCERVQ